jgi:hypothetical protein
MAFRAAAEALGELRRPQLEVTTIGGADHFYTGVRPRLVERLEAWLRQA